MKASIRAGGRADQALVAHGLFDSRARAQAAIAAGLVTRDGQVIRKASETVPAGALVEAEAPHPYVSRGGVKLAAALDAFAIEPAGLVCLDVGASTGGFTDVLLGRGAAKVFAVDVGRGQLHPRIAAEPRVVSLEGTDARSLDATLIPDPVSLLVADASFIALRLVLPAAVALLRPGGHLVALIKPQFEAGRADVRKGVVRDETVHRRVCDETAAQLEDWGLRVLGLIPSPILGGEGNREFLVGAARD